MQNQKLKLRLTQGLPTPLWCYKAHTQWVCEVSVEISTILHDMLGPLWMTIVGKNQKWYNWSLEVQGLCFESLRVRSICSAMPILQFCIFLICDEKEALRSHLANQKKETLALEEEGVHQWVF